MTIDVANLAFKIDSTEAPKATKALDGVTVAAGKTESAVGRLSAETHKAANANNILTRSTGGLSTAVNDTAGEIGRAVGAVGSLSGAAGLLGGIVAAAAGAFAGFKLVDLIKDSTLLAARFETMGIVMRVAGNNAGYTGSQMDAFAKALQKSGISMLESRNVLTQLATAHIDLSNATKLGRAAQDLAVVGNINSSEAFARLVQGIKSGQVEILRTLGLNVNFQNGYERLAATLGTTTVNLTEQQKALSRTNTALTAAASFTGIYEEAMGTAGKQMSSLKRYWEDLEVVLGDNFLPILTDLVVGLTDALKEAQKATAELGRSDVTQALIAGLGGAFKFVEVTVTGVVYVAGQLLRLLGAIISEAAAVARLDFKSVGSIGESFSTDYQAAATSYGNLLNEQLGLGFATAKTTSLTEEQRIAMGKAAAAAQAAADKQAAAAEAAAKAHKKAASEAEQRAKAESRAHEAEVKRSNDYIKSLADEIAQIGATSKEIRALGVARAVAAAPLEGQKNAIANLALEREAAIASAAAYDALADSGAKVRDLWETDAQKIQREGAADAALAEAAGLTAVAAAIRLNTEVMAQHAKANALFNADTSEAASALDDVANALRSAKTPAEELADAFSSVESAVSTAFNAIRNGDWAGAVTGIVAAIGKIQKAWNEGGDLGRVGAVAGVAGAAGQAVGGTAGGFLSGAAGGALAGAQLGSIIPGIGTLVGAGIGAVLGGIFGGSSASGAAKAQKTADAKAAADAAAQKAAETAAQARSQEIQLLELQGKHLEAVAASRADELAAMDASNRARQEEIYALRDAAEAAAKVAALAASRHELDLQFMEATGRAAEAALIRQNDYVASLDASLQPMQRLIDLAKAQTAANEAALKAANDNAATAAKGVTDAHAALTAEYNAQVGAVQGVIDKFSTFESNLRSFGESLSSGALAYLNPRAQYGATKSAFGAIAGLAPGDERRLSGIQSASEAFLAASRASSPTAAAYNRDLAAVRNAVEASRQAAGQQVSAAQRQLDALNAMVAGQIDVKTAIVVGTQGIIAALAGLASAQAAQSTANAVVSGLTNTPANDAFSTAGYGAKNPDLVAYYNSDPQQAIGFGSLDNYLAAHYLTSGKAEGRVFATGGSMKANGPTSGDRVPVNAWVNGGETFSVSRSDSMDRVALALEKLQAGQEAQTRMLAEIARETKTTKDLLRGFTPDGQSLRVIAA